MLGLAPIPGPMGSRGSCQYNQAWLNGADSEPSPGAKYMDFPQISVYCGLFCCLISPAFAWKYLLNQNDSKAAICEDDFVAASYALFIGCKTQGEMISLKLGFLLWARKVFGFFFKFWLGATGPGVLALKPLSQGGCLQAGGLSVKEAPGLLQQMEKRGWSLIPWLRPAISTSLAPFLRTSRLYHSHKMLNCLSNQYLIS